MEYKLTPEWKVTLPDGFQNRKEGEHLTLWTTGCTVITTVFAYSGEQQRNTLLANLRAKAQSNDLELIEDQEGVLYRLGFLQTEVIQPGHTRLVLHAFTTAPYGCLQTSFYLDSTDDLNMVLKAWQSVSYTPIDVENNHHKCPPLGKS
ncbi:MAG: hypothetical protein WA116_10525 [Anaerolineaceae bacterium]